MPVSKPVVQEENTGCGIASVANILGKTYPKMKAIASAVGIHASDKLLWSDTQYVRRMLSHAGVETSKDEIPFESWDALPDLALLSIKHYQEEGKDFWHWVVFKRASGQLSAVQHPLRFRCHAAQMVYRGQKWMSIVNWVGRLGSI